MRVRVIACPWTLVPGGGEIQARRTCQELRRLGVEVEESVLPGDQLPDLVHFYGSGWAEYSRTLAAVQREHVPYVVSTIFWPKRTGWRRRLFSRWVGERAHWSMFRLHREAVRVRLLRGAARILPNTSAEADQLTTNFPFIDPQIIRVVPNGVDERFAHGDPALFREETGITEPFVLNVARIEPRKNQLLLVEAVRSLGWKLVIIGAVSHRAYAEECRERGGDRLILLPPLPHDSPLLAAAYAAAKVFALPSLFETPGIAALEAAVAGTPVVVTPIGGAREYLGDLGLYPDPGSLEDIQRSLQRAWDSEINGEALRQHVLSRYTWRHVAQKTYEVYREVAAESSRVQ